MTPDENLLVTWYAVFVVLLVILLLLIIFCVYYFQNYEECVAAYYNGDVYCYDNYLCIADDGTTINMSQKILFNTTNEGIQKCKPLTEKDLQSYSYKENDGTQISGRSPGAEINIWAVVDGKQCNYNIPGEKDNCPFYEVGDVYWPACNGAAPGDSENSTGGHYYTPPEVAAKLAEDSKARRRLGITNPNQRLNM